jgi:hypothetical protein
VRRSLLHVAAWFAVGVAAVVIVTVAVSLVRGQVTGSRPAPLSAAQVQDELASEGDGTTTTTGSTSSTTTTTAPGAAGTATTTPGGPSATTTSTVAVSGPGPTTTTTTQPPGPAPSSKTYDLVGGTATLRFSTTGVTVLAATPKPGFSVDVSETHENGVRVEFESDDHRSRVDAWWDGGPQDEVREDD